jgi:hypothetical protein
MCACTADRVASHKALAGVLDELPSVEAVVFLAPEASPSGHPETEIVVRAASAGTLPTAVVGAICESACGIVRAVDGNAAGYKRVVVR